MQLQIHAIDNAMEKFLWKFNIVLWLLIKTQMMCLLIETDNKNAQIEH